MSRGKPKPSLRDLSRQIPTREQRTALAAAFDEGAPFVTAILGQALVEHELETLLRTRFKNKDETTWARLTGENGPLNTFSQKITAGHAFGFYDEITRSYLNTIKLIRNAFAHPKRLIDFDEELIAKELKNVALPKHKHGAQHKAIKAVRSQYIDPREAYILLCREVLNRQTRGFKASIRNLRRKRNLISTNVLFSSGLFFPPQEFRAKNLLSSLPSQIFDPTTQAAGPLPLRSQERPSKKK